MKSPNLFDIVSSVCVLFIVARKSLLPLLSACRFVVARVHRRLLHVLFMVARKPPPHVLLRLRRFVVIQPSTFFFFLTNSRCTTPSLPSFFSNHAPPILDLYSRHRSPSQAVTFLPAVVQPSLRLPILEAQSSVRNIEVVAIRPAFSVACKSQPNELDEQTPLTGLPCFTFSLSIHVKYEISSPPHGVGRNFPSFCMSHLDPTSCIIIDYLTGLIESLLPYDCEEARSPFVKKYKTVIHSGEAQYNIDQALQKDTSFRRWVGYEIMFCHNPLKQ
uniref:Uncharacterized protein n=1 Tax=Cucumis melo TaxID=3656 RepID=A0A9I9EDI7_CUCME